MKESDALIILILPADGKVKGYWIPIEKALVDSFWKWYHEAKEGKVKK